MKEAWSAEYKIDWGWLYAVIRLGCALLQADILHHTPTYFFLLTDLNLEGL